MARDWFAFIGPYAEWIRPESEFLAVDEDEEADEWEQLIDGGVLCWNIGSDSGFPMEIEGRRLRRYCAMPYRERPDCPRWPMHLHFNFVEIEYQELATDWTAVNTQLEIEWFRVAFGVELSHASRLMGEEPTFHWGLVHWVIP